MHSVSNSNLFDDCIYHVRSAPSQKEPPPIPDLEKELVELCLEQVKVDEAQREGQLFVRPRKANWDLKRDVVSAFCFRTPTVKKFSTLFFGSLQEKKLEKLDKRTQRAVLELIQQKLKDQGEGAANINLNDAVGKGERSAKGEEMED